MSSAAPTGIILQDRVQGRVGVLSGFGACIGPAHRRETDKHSVCNGIGQQKIGVRNWPDP
jgi:hypothetical protein